MRFPASSSCQELRKFLESSAPLAWDDSASLSKQSTPVVTVLARPMVSYLKSDGFSEHLARHGFDVNVTPVKRFVWLNILYLAPTSEKLILLKTARAHYLFVWGVAKLDR